MKFVYLFCLSISLFVSCKPKPKATAAPTIVKATSKSPNACALLLAGETPAVDPSSLKLDSATITQVSLDTQGKYRIPKISVRPDSNSDNTYYRFCSADATCYDGIINLPDVAKDGWSATYQYFLPASSTPYTVELRSCVRTDRVRIGTKGTPILPALYPNVALQCGSPYLDAKGNKPLFLQTAFPDSTVGDFLKTAKNLQTDLNTKLYAILAIMQTYKQGQPDTSSQFSQMVTNILQMREGFIAFANSSAMDNLLQSTQSTPASTGLALASGSPGSCTTNEQITTLMQGKALALAGDTTSDTSTSSDASSSGPTGGNWVLGGSLIGVGAFVAVLGGGIVAYANARTVGEIIHPTANTLPNAPPDSGTFFKKVNPIYNSSSVRSVDSVRSVRSTGYLIIGPEDIYVTRESMNLKSNEPIYDTVEAVEAKAETPNGEYTSDTMKKKTQVKATSSYEKAIEAAEKSKIELFKPDNSFQVVKKRTLSSSFPKGKAIAGGIVTVLIGVGAIVAGVLVGLDKTGTLASSPEQVAFAKIQALSTKYWEIRTQYQTVLSTLKANIK